MIHPSLFDTLSAVVDSERSPPLYYVLVWGWSKIFGTGEVGLRSLSALFGTLTVPLAYAAAATLGSSRRVALFAAAFVALNPYLVWYSQEARSYALMVLFAPRALVYFARSLERPSPASLAIWALASALALCVALLRRLPDRPQALWLLLRDSRVGKPFSPPRRSRRWGWRWCRSRSTRRRAAGATASPRLRSPRASARRRSTSWRARSRLRLPATRRPTRFSWWRPLGGALLLAAAIALIATRASREERAGAIAAGVVSGGALALPLLLAVLGLDFINPRNLIGVLVPLLIVLAIGFGCRGAGKAGLAAGAATCALFAGVLVAVDVSAQMQRPDWRGAAEALASGGKARVFVVPRNGDDPLAYYLGARKSAGVGARRIRAREIDVLSTNYRVKRPRGDLRAR